MNLKITLLLVFIFAAILGNSCNVPITFFSSGTTGTSTTLSWLPGIATSTQWQVEYGPQGFILGQGTKVIVGPSPQVISGLSGSTAYDFYIREICTNNDTSAWYSPAINVSTPCGTAANAPWFENFEGAQWVPFVNILNKGAYANCWTSNPTLATNGFQWLVNPNTINSPTSGPAGDHTTGSGKYIASQNSAITTTPAIIRSPAINLSTVSNPELNFWYHMFGPGISSLQVQASVIGSNTWTTLLTISGQQQNSSTAPWIEETVSLAGFANQTIYIRFRAESSGTLFNQAKISIDDISIIAGSICPRPSGLTASNVTPTTATVQWLAIPGGQNKLKIGPVGFNPNTAGTASLYTPNVANLTGLTQGTFYHVYVRKICSATDSSAWRGPLLLKTPCIVSAPITETFTSSNWVTPVNFQDSGLVSSCWPRNGDQFYRWTTGPDVFINNLTGPPGDHTTGNGKYLVSITRQAGGTSPYITTIETPFIDLTPLNIPELTFWYHMFGSAIGSLTLEVFNGTTWVNLVTKTGQQQTAKNNPWREEVISLAAYANTTVKFRFTATKTLTTNLNQVAIDDFSILEQPACPKPKNLAANNISFNRVTAAWTTGGATNWRLRYKPVAATTFSFLSTNTNPRVINGLAPNTNYELWVKDSCSATEKSVWVGPVFFRTQCTPFPAPYTESFTGPTWVPWILPNQSGQIDPCFQRSDTLNHYWTVGPPPFNNNFTGPSGDKTTGNGKYAYSRRANTTGTSPTFFRTPWVDLTPVNAPQLRFWLHMFGNGIDKLEVRVIRINGTSQLVETITGQQQFSKPAPWILKTINLSSFANDTIRIAFVSYFNGTSFNADIAIDDLEIGIPLPCFQPTNTLVTNTTSTTTTIQWNSSGNSAGTFIEYGAVGFTPGTGTSVQATSNPFVITGLTPGTNYHFYLRDSCNSGSFSTYSGPLTVNTTPCPPVTASFTFTLTGLTVTFNGSASTGVIYAWSFGDGGIDTVLSPTHTYASGGVYIVTLVVSNACGSTDTMMVTLNLCLAPAPQFTFTATGLSVNFDASSSVGTNLTYSWNFGDGNSGTGVTTNHTYATNGIYSVVLTVTDSCGGSDTITQTLNICATPSATINFTQNGLSVNFDGTSSVGANTYLWDFGDGNTSTQPNPSHTYTTGGTYTVTLTITDICGGTSTTQVTISTCVPPVAAWSAQIISSGGSGMVVQFNGTASIGASTFLWEFGDGNTNTTTPTPLHTYSVPGLFYVVKLTVENACGDKNTLQASLQSIGIDEENKLLVVIYPNPVNDKLLIQLPPALQVERLTAIDVAGKIVHQQGRNNSDFLEINTSHNTERMYFLPITTSKGEWNYKIVVKHE